MSVKRTVSFFILGFLVMFMLAYLYAFVTSFSPIIYLNFVLLLMFGSFIGLVSYLQAYFGVIRERKYWISLSIVNSVLMWYISWIVYILAISNETSFVSMKGFDVFINLLLKPDFVFQTIHDLSNHGVWTVSFLSSDSFTYWMVWIIEFAIFIVAPIMFLKQQSTFPYSELNERWYKEFVLSRDFGSILVFKNALERLETKPIEIIEELGFGKANNYSQISVFYLPNEKVQYISIFHITIDREDKKSKEEIFHLIKLDTQNAKELISKWEGKHNKYIFF